MRTLQGFSMVSRVNADTSETFSVAEYFRTKMQELSQPSTTKSRNDGLPAP